MAAEVYEDELELSVPILEAVLPDSGQYLPTAYPYPSLRPTGRQELRKFRTIVLENPYLRATIVPDLGGRILRLLDKRTNIDILPDEELKPIEGGLRGVEIAQGIQIRFTAQDRLNALGTVNYQLVHATDEEDDAGVWIGEVSGPLSFNALISMPPDAAEIKIELRMFNRVIGDTPYNGGLSMNILGAVIHHAQDRNLVSGGFIAYANDRGMSIWSEDYEEPGLWNDNGRINIHRFAHSTRFALSARQLDTWRFVLRPHSKMAWPMIAFSTGALALTEKGYAFQATRRVSAHRLELRTRDGQCFETSINVHPEQISDLPFPDRQSVAEISFYDDDDEPLYGQHGDIPAQAVSDEPQKGVDDASEMLTSTRAQIHNAQNEVSYDVKKLLPGFRYQGHLESALAHIDPAKRDEILEQALLYNGEDHLAWWIKGATRRTVNPTSEELPEILNAHYLAPLEPALRAEGFLSQPQSQRREPNPILRPLEEAPEQFIDVACQLLDWRLTADAARFIDEALRHVNLPMLHYLLAYALRSETRMEVEAAAHVKAASSKPFGPPFPWRPIEIQALRRLGDRFPNDELIKKYLEIAQRYQSRSS